MLVVGDAGHETKLGFFVRRYGMEIATDRKVDVERVYVAASWVHGNGTFAGSRSRRTFLAVVASGLIPEMLYSV